jgi:hypothetical protein
LKPLIVNQSAYFFKIPINDRLNILFKTNFVVDKKKKIHYRNKYDLYEKIFFIFLSFFPKKMLEKERHNPIMGIRADINIYLYVLKSVAKGIS